MYCAHYGLQKKPFESATDPERLWLSEKHRRALAYLNRGLSENNGFTVITGDIGTGKTALVRRLVKSIGGSPLVVNVPDPDMSRLDFFNFIADALGMNQVFESKAEFLSRFKRFLGAAFSNGRKILLIVDEAQRLSHELLQEIRLLLNIDLSLRMPLKPILVGLTELEAILQQAPNLNVKQRVTASFRIDPLTEKETRTYILYRLRMAGASRVIFTAAALKKIHSHTSGYPRAINALCDHAMMTGYAAGKQTINAEIILECLDELKITFYGGAANLEAEEKVAATHNATQTSAAVEPLPAVVSPRLNQFYALKRYGLALTVVLLLCITGYTLFHQLFDRTPSIAGSDQAMQQMVRILESQSNESNRDWSTAIDFGHEMAEEVTMVDLVEQSQPTESLEFDRLIIRKKIEVPAADKTVVRGLDR